VLWMPVSCLHRATTKSGAEKRRLGVKQGFPADFPINIYVIYIKQSNDQKKSKECRSPSSPEWPKSGGASAGSRCRAVTKPDAPSARLAPRSLYAEAVVLLHVIRHSLVFCHVSSRNHSKIWHPKIQSFGSDLITGLEGKSKIFDRLGNPSFQLHALPQFCWWVSFCLRGSRQLQSPTQKKRTWWFQFFYCPSHLGGYPQIFP